MEMEGFRRPLGMGQLYRKAAVYVGLRQLQPLWGGLNTGQTFEGAEGSGAGEGSRTLDLRFTKPLLCH